ncbi:hypothetical protein [Lacticaseibacillus suibinensis]|uniref:hypothetical protein n=1 Tax=Lacticaseibacillus suibinensis TaxID=2486011 RepID=UPI000F7AD50B|nr:hypothetical protein [Lacticaseibacillus suibinensis]
MLTQATNWISWALDGVLDNLLQLLNALGYLLLVPFKFLFKWIFQPIFGYILKAIFGDSLPGVGMFLGVLVLLFVAFWVIYAWPAFFDALLLVPFLGGLFVALGNLFRFGAKTLIAAGIIWIFWQLIKAASRLIDRADAWVDAKRSHPRRG